MTIKEARKWLGVYFISITALTGIFLLLFSDTLILPLSQKEAQSSFQIIIPVLVGQITVIFKWVANADNTGQDIQCPIPDWAITLPPLFAIIIILAAIVVLFLSNIENLHWTASPETFQNAITFAVTILNASTVFLVARLFPSKENT